MKLFIAIPSYTGTITSQCMLGVVGLIQVLNSEHSITTILGLNSYNGNVASARNELVREFLTTDCTHILFIDDDIGFKPKDVELMISSVPIAGEHGVIGALCPRKLPSTGEASYDLYEPLHDDLRGGNWLVPVKRVGTGVMLIPRQVFTRLTPVIRGYDGLPQYFLTIMGEQHISEDYYFCDTLVEAGIPIHIAMWTDVVHVGRYCFGGHTK